MSSLVFESIEFWDFLSFGPGSHTLALRPLNVLIGPNGSGKSNLIEAFAVLRAVQGDLGLPIRKGGGVNDWLWNGPEASEKAGICVVFSAASGISDSDPSPAVAYRIEFGGEAGRFVVRDERIENVQSKVVGRQPHFYFGYENGRPYLNSKEKAKRYLSLASIDRTQSVLSQRKDPENYPEVARVGELLGRILIYRSWSFGPNAACRGACSTDVRTERLEEDFSNLPARLMALQKSPSTKRRLIDLLGRVAPGFTDFSVTLEGATLHLYLTEGEHLVSAHRLSDGTLRYLCLLAILIDPGPASLVIIEEPELGLHPDMMSTLRDLMVEASERVQLIVTTHSSILVDTLTDHADAVVVCEKADRTTEARRLTQDEVDHWREFGSLGSLWTSGQFGGTRW